MTVEQFKKANALFIESVEEYEKALSAVAGSYYSLDFIDQLQELKKAVDRSREAAETARDALK